MMLVCRYKWKNLCIGMHRNYGNSKFKYVNGGLCKARAVKEEYHTVTNYFLANSYINVFLIKNSLLRNWWKIKEMRCINRSNKITNLTS